MPNYKQQAKKYYKHCVPKLFKKAVDSGILLDNRLKTEYTKGGHTNSFFDITIYLKYFSFEALTKIGAHDRNYQYKIK